MRIKLSLATITAALLMGAATSGAAARNISISHNELFNASWRQLRFIGGGGLTAAECDVTIEGSFHYRTMIKVSESLVGYITRAAVNNCTTGSATVLTTNLPWHIRYRGFQGALPDIATIRFILVLGEFKVHDRIFGTECLVRSTTTEPTMGVVNLAAGNERRLMTSFTADPANTFRCGTSTGAFEGTGRVRESQF